MNYDHVELRSSRPIRVLIIPAASEQPCQVTFVEYSAVALSDAIGGGLLADIYYGHHITNCGSEDPAASDEAERFCLYADEHRTAKRLPVNPRAAVLPGWPASMICVASR